VLCKVVRHSDARDALLQGKLVLELISEGPPDSVLGTVRPRTSVRL
jgi:hypothetical protein